MSVEVGKSAQPSARRNEYPLNANADIPQMLGGPEIVFRETRFLLAFLLPFLIGDVARIVGILDLSRSRETRVPRVPIN